jgi:hypothetical protein
VVRSKKSFEPRSGGSKWRNDLTQATEYSLLSPLRGLPNSIKSFTAGLRPQLHAAAATRLKSKNHLDSSSKLTTEKSTYFRETHTVWPDKAELTMDRLGNTMSSHSALCHRESYCKRGSTQRKPYVSIP